MVNLPAVPGATLVAILVDRSGSMGEYRTAMEDGLNHFIADQADLPQAGALMLAEFDDQYAVRWPLQGMAARCYELQPRGRTALYDAVGKYITHVNETLAAETVYRPVVMCIVTDGAENGSKEWNQTAVTEWIKHQREVYGWTFVFLGANIDAVKVGARFGIPPENALTFNPHKPDASYRALHHHVAALRAGRQAAFSADDRRKAIEG